MHPNPRYRSLAPWDFAPGSPKFDNPVKHPAELVYYKPAVRSPHDPSSFRHATAEKPLESPAVAANVPLTEPQPAEESIPEPDDAQTDGMREFPSAY